MTARDEEMDDTEMWRQLKRASSERRAENRESSVTILKTHGVEFTSHNFGAHLIVKHAGKAVDFWPGTGKWVDRTDRRIKRRGVFSLLVYLGRLQGAG